MRSWLQNTSNYCGSRSLTWPDSPCSTNPSNPAVATQIKRIQAVTKGLGITIFKVQSANVEGNAQAFATMARERAEAVIILNDTFFVQQASQLAHLAIKHRLASIFGTQDYARAGGLMSYGPKWRIIFAGQRPTSTKYSKAPNEATCRSSSRRAIC